MADIDIERRPKGNVLPWLIGLAILALIVGWLLWRNNRIEGVGRLDVHPTVFVVADHALEAPRTLA